MFHDLSESKAFGPSLRATKPFYPEMGSREAEWLARLLSDLKVRGSIPGSNPLYSCHCDTVTYKLLKFIFTVYNPVFRMRR